MPHDAGFVGDCLMLARLTRQSFLNSVACPRMGWFSRLESPPLQLVSEQGTLAERFRGDEQKDLHDHARALFPDAALVTRQAYEAACWQTQDLLDRPSTRVILEAAFWTANCRARANALVRTGETWHLYEVKARTSLTEELVDEVAFVQMVLDAAGVNLGGASLLLVSGDYRTGMPEHALFVPEDVTARAAPRAVQFAGLVTTIDAQTRVPEPPTARLIPHCRRCPLFRSCTGAGITHPIFELPHVAPLQLENLLAQGHHAVTDLPDSTLLKKRQSAVWRSITTGQAVLTGDLRGNLDAVVWPACYLDFETVGTAIPLFPDLAPFEQFPFLYSVRVCDGPGTMQTHRAFLASHERDGSRELAERLLQDLGSEGSVIIYSQYQTRVLRWLARRHPDLAEALGRLRVRLVDLESIVRRDLSHPGFHGRTSIKTVLPALVPGFSYIDLEIEDALSASASFAYLSKGGYFSAARAPLVRRDLYAYCARDTLALVKLHEALCNIARHE
jgi:hypothetical protein